MKRILTATLLILIVVALIFFGQLWMLTLAACVIAELAAYEYFHLANSSGARIPGWWMAASTALLFYVTFYRPIDAQLPTLSVLALVLLAWAGFRGSLDRVLPDAALCVLPRAGHLLNLEEPARFNDIVSGFIDAVERGRWRGWAGRTIGAD